MVDSIFRIAFRNTMGYWELSIRCVEFGNDGSCDTMWCFHGAA